MLRLHLLAWLAKALTILLCWLVLMGVPLLLFEKPQSPSEWKLFLGVFYALLLGAGVLVGRSWGGMGVLWVAFPFMMLFTGVVVSTVANPVMADVDKANTALNFLAIYLVTWLAWRIGKRLKSPARDSGKLM